MFARSEALIQAAKKVIPGGVNSPVRAFRGVGGTPVFFESGHGAQVKDVDGNEYIDYVGSWGPMILGHTPPAVVEAVQRQAATALGFGAPTELEIELANEIIATVPSVERVRLVNSGTEATMSAIRVARGHTGRDLILKFTGCYHGHSDSLLVKAGSGVLTLGIPDSPGVPANIAELTLSLPFNDADAVAAVFAEFGSKIAAVIVEPVAGNMGCIPPQPGFLQSLRDQCTNHASVLIFDEVMTGFRVAHGGAQALYGITPDLTTMGKVIGGGLPLAAFGGSAEVMANVAPEGNVYQAGTLSGNPIAVSAGLATLRALHADDFYTKLEASTARLAAGLEQAAADAGVPVTVNQVCGMLSMFFTDTAGKAVSSYDDVAQTDAGAYAKMFHGLLERGVYLAPSAFEVAFLSAAHTDALVDQTIAQVAATLQAS